MRLYNSPLCIREDEDPDTNDPGSMLGEMMDCARCGCKKKCIRIIPANMKHADPTEAYELECGHVVI